MEKEKELHQKERLLKKLMYIATTYIFFKTIILTKLQNYNLRKVKIRNSDKKINKIANL